MRLILVRHAHAVDEEEGLLDSDRWLNPKGRSAARELSGWLRDWVAVREVGAGLVVWTSPLVRAVQTAEVLAANVVTAAASAAEVGVEVSIELRPAHALEALVQRLQRYDGKDALLLVGHEPKLGLLARALLRDSEFQGFRKAGCVVLDWDGRTAGRLVAARRVRDQGPLSR